MIQQQPIDRRTMLAQVTAGLVATQTVSWAKADESEPVAADDPRFGQLKDLNGYFPMSVPGTVAEWERRSEVLRRQIKAAAGLWPMPTRSPLKPVVHGTIDRDTYQVSKVYFESSPGLYVTGNLYMPKGVEGKSPGILCPHGHWNRGRFFDHGELKVRTEVKGGAEKHVVGGRHPLQARCVQLARMGCVVFHYDMLGYADNVPITAGIAHGFSKQRPTMSGQEDWGLFSAQSELRLLNPLGLQTFNSVRALDWLLTLEQVDPDRIGVTGASGGGTQTFMLAAVDDRPGVLFPAVMVSTAMQGGCTCENATYLRIGTGNIEMAALTAPRPLGMSAANDWTRELETKGLPELKQLYELLGVGDLVEGKHFPFGHNYNYVSRAMMYEFFNKHLQLGQQSPIVEEDYEPLTTEELSVWNDEHPKPPAGDEPERAVVRWFAQDQQKQLAEMTPSDQGSLEAFRKIVGGGWRVMIGRELPDPSEVEWLPEPPTAMGTTTRQEGMLVLASEQETVPVTLLTPDGAMDRVALWLSPLGREGLFKDEQLNPAVARLLKQGIHVAGVDLFGQGTKQRPGQASTRSRAMENKREAACYVLGYNHPFIAQQVHDVMTSLVGARRLVGGGGLIDIVGVEGTGIHAAAAAFAARGEIHRLVVGTRGFRFQQITDIEDPMLWPGAVRYGDVPALLGLCAPTPLWVNGEGSTRSGLAVSCYQAAGAADAFSVGQGAEDAAITWLLG